MTQRGPEDGSDDLNLRSDAQRVRPILVSATLACLVVLWSCDDKPRASAPPAASETPESTFSASSYEDTAVASTGRARVAPEGEICNDCVSLRRVMALGDLEGPGFIDVTDRIVRDKEGRYWAGLVGALKVYDPDGRFVRQVGRVGQGPMEFRYPAPFHVDSSGNVHVADLQGAHITVIRPTFELERTTLLPSVAHYAAALPDEKRYVLNMLLPTAEHIGMPIHVLESSRAIHSFGMPSEEGRVDIRGVATRRLVTADRRGRVISVSPHRYFVEIWTQTGERIAAFPGPEFNERSDVNAPWSWTNPPGDLITALDVDDRNHLWIARMQLRANWRDSMREIRRSGDAVYIQPAGDDLRQMYSGRIDILDLESGRVLAQSEHEPLIVAFLRGSLAAAPEYEGGIPRMGIWSLVWRN